MARARRESYAREVGIAPARESIVHDQLVESWARHLDQVRQRWADFRESEKALAALRVKLPEAVSGRVRSRASHMIAQLEQWIDDSRPPAWMRCPEDKWLVDAQHELDDDELARILSPAGFSRDREAALRAVRERRRKIARRR